MSTPSPQAGKDIQDKAGQRYAKLVRGRVYMLMSGEEFEQGAFVAVDPAIEAYLAAWAVDLITLEDEGETQARPKFKFYSQVERDAEEDRDDLAARMPDVAINPARPTQRNRQRT